MTASKLLADLRTRGVRIDVTGDKLLVDAPEGVLTAELVEWLREHKTEVIVLRGQTRPQRRAPTAKSSPHPFAPDPNDVRIVRERLAASGVGWVSIRSETLGGELVVFVRDGRVKVPSDQSQLLRYTWSELQQLMDATPEALRVLHQFKQRDWVLRCFDSKKPATRGTCRTEGATMQYLKV
jgi:hypothetical protein